MIRCGLEHSYVRTETGDHYLFGSNDDGECMVDNMKYVKMPVCINDKIEEIGADMDIEEISPGFFNSKIICVEK